MALMVVFIGLSLNGCSEKPDSPINGIGCAIGVEIGKGLSGQLAEVLACSNQAAIDADMYEALVKIKVCSPVSKSVIPPSLCKFAGRALFDALTNEKFAKWECEGGLAKEKLFDKLDELCGKLP